MKPMHTKPEKIYVKVDSSFDPTLEGQVVRFSDKIAYVHHDMDLSLIHISEPTRPNDTSRMPSAA